MIATDLNGQALKDFARDSEYNWAQKRHNGAYKNLVFIRNDFSSQIEQYLE